MNNSLAAGYLHLGNLCRSKNRKYFEKSLTQLPFPVLLDVLTKSNDLDTLNLDSEQEWFLETIESIYELLTSQFSQIFLARCTLERVPTRINLNNISPQNPISFTIEIQDITYDINIIGQLGIPGKEGVTYLVEQDLGGGIITRKAMKVFKKDKSVKKVEKEAAIQQKAGIAGISPQVYCVSDSGIKKLHHTGPFILMDLIPGDTLVKLAEKMNGILTDEQQYNLLNIALDMDDVQIRHNDANPLNIMYLYESGQFMYIDFGMSRMSKGKDNYANFRALHAALHSGTYGLVSRKSLKPGGYDIIEYWITKYTNAGNILTPEDIVIIRNSRT